MTPAPTLRQVADLAGVSMKTVSRVINADPAVAPATAERVQQAITALAYRPNPLARSLRTGRDDAIGLVVESISDPFFASVTEAIADASSERGLFLVFASASTAEQERAAVRGLLQRSVRGLVLVPSSLDYGEHGLDLMSRAVPVVFIDRPPIGLEADTVLIENEQAGCAATNHLVRHGHRRIALVATYADTWTVRNRIDGYRRALAEAGIADDHRLLAVAQRAEQIPAALAGLLEAPDPPTAVLSANAVASIGVVHALHRLARTDVAFVSFDDFATADALVPAVSVVRQDPALMGRVAVELLFARLDGDGSPPRRVVLPVEVVARGSGELPPPPAPPAGNGLASHPKPRTPAAAKRA